MKKLNQFFTRLPPRQPLTSLAAIVDDWNYRFGQEGHDRDRRDQVVAYTAAASSFPEAVRRATASRDSKGKMHNHQSRVREADRHAFARLIERKSWSSFDQLYDELSRIAPIGIGPVTVYDVAVRLGAYLRLAPGSLYLHAGVRMGWLKLFGELPKAERVPLQELPRALHSLDADSLEDFFCTYRDIFHPAMLSPEE